MPRNDQVRVTARCIRPEAFDLGEFPKKAGGRLTSVDVRGRTSAGFRTKIRGGVPIVEDLVIAREDTGELMALLAHLRGRADIEVYETPLDDDGNHLEHLTVIYHGRLLGLESDDVDADDGGTLRLIRLEIGCSHVTTKPLAA